MKIKSISALCFLAGSSLAQASRPVSARYLVRSSDELSVGIGNIYLFTVQQTFQVFKTWKVLLKASQINNALFQKR